MLGDRDGDLGLLAGRSWDVCVDVSGYLPRLVRDSATALRDSVEPLRLRLDDLGVRRPRRAARRDRPAGDDRGRDDGGDLGGRGLRRAEGALRARRDRRLRRAGRDRAARVRHRPARPHGTVSVVGAPGSARRRDDRAGLAGAGVPGDRHPRPRRLPAPPRALAAHRRLQRDRACAAGDDARPRRGGRECERRRPQRRGGRRRVPHGAGDRERASALGGRPGLGRLGPGRRLARRSAPG